MVVIIWGVSGAGKTTIGELLAQELHWKFYDGDDFHPSANVDKMEKGAALTDEDRQPWLESLRKAIERSLAANENAVLACSALKKKYRELLRVSADVKFVFLQEVVRESPSS
jgi:gluconokinase